MLDYTTSIHYSKWVHKDIWLMLKLHLLVNFIHIGLLFFGLTRTQEFLKSFEKKSPPIFFLTEAQVLVFREHTRRIFRKLRKNKFLLSNCLSTSLLCWLLLKNQGLDTHLLIGARHKEGKFKAHAWVEYQQLPLNAGLKVHNKYSSFNNYNFSNNFIL